MENLVNAVYYLHSEIEHSFRGTMTLEEFSAAEKDCERLGALGLALHYAYIIVQIDGLVSRAASVPLQARDNLYQSLPPTNMLLNTLYFQQELEKILSWLTPMANNTIKVHHGFGWVGEWANAGSSSDSNITEQPQFSLQTLHYADRAAMEECILELLVLLHYLVASAQENVADSMHSSYACPSVQSRDDIPDSQTSFASNNVQCGILSTGEPTNLSTQAKPCHEKLPNKENSLYALMKNESQSIKDELSLSFLDRVHSLEVDRVKSLDRMDRVEDIDSMHSARTPLADGNIKMQISLDH